jgi:hypothetical protein
VSEFTLFCLPEEWPEHPVPKDHTDRHLIEHLLKGQWNIMADLTNLSAALDQLGTDIATEATDVETKLQALLDAIAGLSVGSITQAQIDDLTTKAAAADAAVQAVDAAANAANPPAAPVVPAP